MYKASINERYLERIIRLIAGIMSLIGIVGYYYLSEWFLLINIVIGINLIVFSLTGYCVMTIFLNNIGFKSCCK